MAAVAHDWAQVCDKGALIISGAQCGRIHGPALSGVRFMVALDSSCGDGGDGCGGYGGGARVTQCGTTGPQSNRKNTVTGATWRGVAVALRVIDPRAVMSAFPNMTNLMFETWLACVTFGWAAKPQRKG